MGSRIESVEELAELEGDSGGDERNRTEVRERIHKGIDAPADPVANRHRLQEGHDEVRARGHPPEPERLPEVLSALLDPVVLRRVEQPTDAERAVDQKAGHLAASAAELPLQQAVDHSRAEGTVV